MFIDVYVAVSLEQTCYASLWKRWQRPVCVLCSATWGRAGRRVWLSLSWCQFWRKPICRLLDTNRNKIFCQKFNFRSEDPSCSRTAEAQVAPLTCQVQHFWAFFAPAYHYCKNPLCVQWNSGGDCCRKLTAKLATIYCCTPFFEDLDECLWFACGGRALLFPKPAASGSFPILLLTSDL